MRQRAALLLASASVEVRAELGALSGLEELLDARLAEVRRAHPAFAVDEAGFLRHVAARLPTGAALPALRWPDLFLAFACLQHQPGALDAFDRTVLVPLSRAIERLAGPNVDEVCQQLREKLFVGAEPAISQYQGRGPLKEWTRACVARLAINLYRDAKAVPEGDDSLLGRLPFEGGNQELDLIRKQFQHQFAEAFAHALSLLTPRERTLLRMHLLEGLTFAEIGAFYRVDPSTASRWVVGARRDVLRATKHYLANNLNLTPSEMTSVLGRVRSEVDLRISGFLAG